MAVMINRLLRITAGPHLGHFVLVEAAKDESGFQVLVAENEDLSGIVQSLYLDSFEELNCWFREQNLFVD